MSDNPYKVNAPLDLKAGYRPLRRSYRALAIILYAVLALTIFDVMIRAAYLFPFLVGEVPLATIGSNTDLLGYAFLLASLSMVRGALDFLLTIALIIIFLFWIHSAYKNLEFFGVYRRMSAGFATASFFIPVVNLWLPYRAMQDLSRGSKPARLTDPASVYDTPVGESSPGSLSVRPGGRISLWWAFVVLAAFTTISGFFNSMVQGVGAHREGGILFLTLFGAGAALLQLIAYFLTLKVIGTVTRDQEVHARLATGKPGDHQSVR